MTNLAPAVWLQAAEAAVPSGARPDLQIPADDEHIIDGWAVWRNEDTILVCRAWSTHSQAGFGMIKNGKTQQEADTEFVRSAASFSPRMLFSKESDALRQRLHEVASEHVEWIKNAFDAIAHVHRVEAIPERNPPVHNLPGFEKARSQPDGL